MRRFRMTEPLVMLATVLAAFTGAVVGLGCTIFLRALFATGGHANAAPRWMLALVLPLGGFANGLLLRYG